MQGVGIGQWWEETRRHVAEAIEAGGSLTSANVGPNAVVLLSCINYVQPCTAADHSDCMLPDRLRLMSLVLLRSFPTSKFSVAQDADEAGSFVQYLGQVVVVWTVREAGAPSMLMAYAVG